MTWRTYVEITMQSLARLIEELHESYHAPGHTPQQTSELKASMMVVGYILDAMTKDYPKLVANDEIEGKNGSPFSSN